jgi:antitoxin CptB
VPTTRTLPGAPDAARDNAAPCAGGADERRYARLRWRCRRGMLENDLILARFLDARGEAITEDEVAALDRLLDLNDNELWDLMSGRCEPADAALGPLVAALRAA